MAGQSYEDWETIYHQNVVGIYRLVYGRVGNRPDAEDITAEVFLAALRRLRLPAPVPSVRAYLVATARTVLADHWRRHYSAPTAISFVEGLAADLPVPWAEGEAAERATRVMSQLPDQPRRVLELRFLRGYSIKETAADMGITSANARVLQHRALRRAAELEAELE
ncbi:MAG: sigma-70 family RNA polymerase sigma factor [Candidatus Dormibacteraeota bacterium]|uniref:Sigma-70 family RNA polymerase sigma factor n=1 Tax=Candidatus Dormiibacter inghamiae TaxID=3127013 RepID=A0A934N801_9BACT|nr:sigma-70 family RNA polymerase sigma factor [Candidatus Dormibacteraeota bacterium]MBJ7606347.1 sigma-70 family RNA polymerase sigma factor [Candidatus Dormibacteraeota bacterium]